ncbi:cytochrome c oxidase subunit II [Stutzerimonas azotifigens]|uniref:cytochrome c oxidase subunit II n=1 Tax=Stutzerimonas azotifigens TaxID=291995 RepID=UPI000429B976|nr:cytochrome c oxidase subunit II [Stutzerimonas azotifigens]
MLAACEGAQSTLDPAGPQARQVALIWWWMFGVAGVVLVGVSGLWIYASARKPRDVGSEEAIRINRRWVIGGGILLPTIAIVLLLIFGLPAGRSMLPLPLPGEQVLRIEVTGHQWWWEIRYPDGQVVTANQLVLPVGRPIDFHVTSADVIHSFWVPRLGGKVDMIPGRTNVIRLEAAQPGRFRGQCSEFCGRQHARMILPVEAVDAAEFDAWIAARRQLVFARLPDGEAGDLFRDRCGQCHRVAGLTDGDRAPDLTDLASRPTLGAGLLPNDGEHLRRWLREHQELKSGNAMPLHDDIPDATLERIAAWLETLEP